MRVNTNATDLLKEVVSRRNWYKGKLSTQLANRYKKSAIAGTIKYSTACELLEKLGYKKIKEEVWEIVKV